MKEALIHMVKNGEKSKSKLKEPPKEYERII